MAEGSVESGTSMLRSFVAQLVTKNGGVVESAGPHCLEFVAPAPLRQALRLTEFGRLGFGQDAPPDAERVTFESDWLRRFQEALGERGRSYRSVIYSEPPPLMHPERVLEHGFVLQNAIHRLSGVTAAWTRYLLMSFRYAALSDDRRDGIVHLAVNLSTSSTPDEFIPAFYSAAQSPASRTDNSTPSWARLPATWNPERLDRFIRSGLPPRVEQSLRPFLAGIRRRLDRDLDRLFDYYGRLCQESLARGNKPAGDAAREEKRMAAIQHEYGAKVTDLKQKYALKVEVEPLQTLELVMQVRRLELVIKRRKKERRAFLDWNPLVRKLEPVPCEYSFTNEAGRMVCDEALHIVSLPAHAACKECGKEYCRACHPRKCPRNHHE